MERLSLSGLDDVGVRAFVEQASGRTLDEAGVALARAVYEDRAFARLPLLGDALMDAGCADDHLLAHCRRGGPHVRGCWAVDLVLGKE